MSDTTFPAQLAEMEAEQCGGDPGTLEAERANAAYERMSAAVEELYQIASKGDFAAACRAATLRFEVRAAATDYGKHRELRAIERMEAAWDKSNKRIFGAYEAQRRG